MGTRKSTDRVDLNQADAEPLMRIEGIDGERARLILEFRSEHGPFRSWEEVERVPGMGPILCEKAKEAGSLGGDGGTEPEEAGAEAQATNAGEEAQATNAGEEADETTEQELELAEQELELAEQEDELAEQEEEMTELEVLTALGELDAEAAEAYRLAAEGSDDEEVRRALDAFRGDHLRHVDDLNGLIRSLGGEEVSKQLDDLTSALIMVTAAVSPLGTRAAILAMTASEELTNSVYSTALDLMWDEKALPVIQRNYADEQRHLAWLLAQAERFERAEQSETTAT
jgi:competence ComEA-like helix-hairpin-helix protein